MRVLHISTPMSWRGGERQALLLASELTRQGHQSFLHCPIGSVMEARAVKADVPVFPFKKTTVFHPRLNKGVRRMARDLKVDVIHAHDPNAHTMAFLAAWVWGLKTPIIVSRRVDFRPKEKWFTRLKYESPHVKSIICVSEYIHTVMSGYMKDDSKLQVVHSGIDRPVNKAINQQVINQIRTSLCLSNEMKLVGNVAALVDHKDYPTFLRTAGRVLEKRNDCHFIIIGSGPDREKLEVEVRKHGLTGWVHFLGYRPDAAELIAELDVFLFTSKMEGLGTTVLDAFRAGVPVVATAGGGIPEMVVHGRSGLLANVGDDEALFRYVIQALDNETLRTQLIHGADQKLAQFGADVTASKTLDIYQTILCG